MKNLSLFETEKDWWHTKQLKSLLLVLKNFIEPRSYLPVLSTICFDKNLMVATNLDMRLEIDFNSNINNCIPFQELQKLANQPIKTLLDLKDLTFKNNTEVITIKNTIEVEEFPPPPALSEILWSGKINPSNLIGLEKIANDELRDSTSHVTIEIDGNNLILHASDGFMSMIRRIPSGNDNTIFSIPSYSVVPLFHLTKFFNIKNVECYFDNSTIVFSSPGYFKLFVPVNLDMAIPNYDSIYPFDNPIFTATINTKLAISQLTKIIRNHSLSRDRAFPIPNMEFSDKLCVEIEGSQYQINWKTDCIEKHLDAYNLVKLNILLTLFKSKQVFLRYINPETPLVIEGENEMALLMGVRS